MNDAQRFWIESAFSAQAVGKGGIIRRNISDVHRYAGYENFAAAAQERGFHMISVGDQYIVICNPGSISLIF
nr:hypothetical protein [Methylobacterium sp. ZNC0032]